MAKYIDISGIFRKVRENRVNRMLHRIEIGRMMGHKSVKKAFKKIKGGFFVTWLDKLTFVRIFLIWLAIVFIFGAMYYFFIDTNSYLYYNTYSKPVDSLRNTIYFSFVTATSTGFGDIIPVGFFKAIAIFEVIFGLLLLAVVTSKIISIKQDIILGELYELSLNEKINRLRAALLLFRQNISRLIIKIEDGSAKKREISDIYIYLSSLEDIITEATGLLKRKSKSDFTLKVDAVNTELLLNSILNSIEKLNELITSLNHDKIGWKRELTLSLLQRCLLLSDKLFQDSDECRLNVSSSTFDDLKKWNNKNLSQIRASL